ncbi:MAG: hypothetical protein ABW068_17385 [Candidatus Thiodiazotropha sp.]
MRLLILLFLLWPVTASGQQGITEDYAPVVAQIIERGDKAVSNYALERAVVTGNEFSRLYFDVFESSGMEFTLGLKDQSFMLEIESGFSQMISLAMDGREKSVLTVTWEALKQKLHYAAEHYSSSEGSVGFWGLVL